MSVLVAPDRADEVRWKAIFRVQARQQQLADPVLQGHRTDAGAWAMDRLGYQPDPWQLRAMRSTARQQIWNCSRQSGKSRTAGVLAAHEACFGEPSPILLLSRALRQSQELFRKVKAALAVAGRSGAAPRIVQESALQLELDNGARVISLPGSQGEDAGETIRGYSGARLLVIDEAARVPDGLYYAVRPMLATTNGRLILLSTPYGKRGFFHQEWTAGEGWERIEVRARDVPRITAEFLEREHRDLPPRLYRQEYEASFEETEDTVFGYDDITAMMDPDLLPLFAAAGGGGVLEPMEGLG